MTFPQSILDFLAAHNTLTLATAGADGGPHAAALFYAYTPDLRLVFLSDPESKHGQHIGKGEVVAATIQADGQEWRRITGLQMHGFAEPADDAMRSVYLARFPFVSTASSLTRAMEKVQFYQITPTWIRLIDNRLGFGHKQEWRYD